MKKTLKHWKRLFTLFLLSLMLIGGQPAQAAGASSALLTPVASGTAVKQTSQAVVDYSNASDGYVMVRFTAASSKKLKAMVVGPSGTYTYNLTAGQWAVLPFTQGNGSYKVGVYENTTGSKYAEAAATSVSVTLKDEFAPFLRPNQYVDYTPAANTMAKAKELAGSETDALKLVGKVYNYVVTNMTYDQQLASKVSGTSGYLPVLDSVLAAKKGICFDYAALMTGMLRTLGIPCKLVTGYVPLGNGQTGYHAWINVWTKESGWIEKVIYFDGSTWQRMDPTFASSAKQSDSIMKFIGDGSNYTPQKFY